MCRVKAAIEVEFLRTCSSVGKRIFCSSRKLWSLLDARAPCDPSQACEPSPTICATAERCGTMSGDLFLTSNSSRYYRIYRPCLRCGLKLHRDGHQISRLVEFRCVDRKRTTNPYRFSWTNCPFAIGMCWDCRTEKEKKRLAKFDEKYAEAHPRPKKEGRKLEQWRRERGFLPPTALGRFLFPGAIWWDILQVRWKWDGERWELAPRPIPPPPPPPINEDDD